MSHYIAPERMDVLKTYAEPAGIKIHVINHARATGQFDLDDLNEKVSWDTAGVYARAR